MNAAPNSRLTILTFGALTNRRVPSPGRCHDRISVTVTGAFVITLGIITIMTTAKCFQIRNTTMDPLRPTYWKFGLLGVTPVILFVSTSICLLLTSSCRHWWGVSPEWHTAHLGQNPTSLDGSPMFSCRHRNPVLPPDLQTHWSRSSYSLPFRNPTARGP